MLFCRYYLATLETDPAVQHLYRISLLNPNQQSKCLSCNVKGNSDGVRCLYNLAQFSSGNSHYVLTCAGPGVPDISIYDKVSHFSSIYLSKESLLIRCAPDSKQPKNTRNTCLDSMDEIEFLSHAVSSWQMRFYLQSSQSYFHTLYFFIPFQNLIFNTPYLIILLYKLYTFFKLTDSNNLFFQKKISLSLYINKAEKIKIQSITDFRNRKNN